MLKITHYGHTSFVLESKETSVLLNPGIWDGTKTVPDNLDVRLIMATSHLDDALGNAVAIAANSKSWILGNTKTIERAKEQGGKAWLLHELKPETPYEIPGLRLTPYPLQRGGSGTGQTVENLGFYIEMGHMRVGYLGDTLIRGPFGQLELDILITPIGGGEVFQVKDAVALCTDSKPKLAIPMRWSAEDQPTKFVRYVEQFVEGCTPLRMEAGQYVEAQWAAGHEFKYQMS
ncbi:MAG: MBL fold metallo-hydrolase [Candidatus Thorarchaeota archaeon]|nr:MBL fold metallo-hydrolase [Candidatus Thorarchaeota archaeon]